jgi:drug/metabolite transporter (DMT)-like permease
MELHFIILMNSFIPTITIFISLPSVELVFLRTFAALLMLAVTVKLLKISLGIDTKEFLQIFASGILTSIYWMLLALAAKLSNASVTLTGLATIPLWISLINPLFVGKKPNLYQVLTGLTAFFGVFVVVNAGFSYNWGLAVAITAAFCGGLLTIINARLGQKRHHLVITFYQMLGAWIGTSVFLPVYGGWLKGSPLELIPSLSDLLLILGLAFMFSVYAYSALIRIMGVLSPFTVAITTNISPIYGMLSAVFIFGKKEVMNIYFYSGALIIIASVIAYPLVNYLIKLIQKESL